MKPHRPPAPKTVDEYLSAVPAEFRSALEDLRRTVRAAAPKAGETISYGLPAVRQGRVLVYFGAFKDHLSFFPGSARVRREFSSELAPYEGGKGTLHFRPDRTLPADLVRRIVKARLAEEAGRTGRSARTATRGRTPAPPRRRADAR